MKKIYKVEITKKQIQALLSLKYAIKKKMGNYCTMREVIRIAPNASLGTLQTAFNSLEHRWKLLKRSKVLGAVCGNYVNHYSVTEEGDKLIRQIITEMLERDK